MEEARSQRAAGPVLALLLSFVWLASGCAGGGFGLAKVEADPTILTGALPPGTDTPPGSQIVSDQATIRNAVSSADIADLRARSISWANVDTGSRGAITGVTETREGRILCRRFTASRESFEGVALYRGEACSGADGAWWMRAFDES